MAPGLSFDVEPYAIKRKLCESSTSLPKRRKPAVDIIIPDNIKGMVQCKLCHQVQVENVNIPFNAESECIVLANEVLANIYTDNTDMVQHNLTNFSIYDENGHMCSIDSGVMERKVELYLTGYVKPIYDHNPCIARGIAAEKLGPISEWWLSSYDGGSQVIIGVSTDYAEYLLIEPHSSYKKYMLSVTKKVHLSTLVIKFMLNSEHDNPIYEDVLNYITDSVNPVTGVKFTEEDLISHAQFVIDQITDYDSNDTYHLPLGETHCIETLTKLSGALKPVKALSIRRQRAGYKTRYEKTDVINNKFSKATTTELVKDVFESMFAAQLDVNDKKNEENMSKLVKNIFDDVCSARMKREFYDVSNIGENQMMWKDQKLCENMFIVVKNNISSVPLIGRIEYLYKTSFKDMAHILLFMHGYETVLGETSDSQEIFVLKKCTNIDINCIVKILDVSQKIPSDDWFNLGASKLQDVLEPVIRNDKKSFFYQLQYDEELGRFEYPKPCNIRKDKYCSNCEADNLKEKSQIPELLEFIERDRSITYFYKLKLHNEEYKVGNFIYLQPGIFSSASRSNFVGKKPFVHSESITNRNHQLLEDVDETRFPEYYRKMPENTMCGSNTTTPDPFEIAEILAMYKVDWDEENARLIVRRMYRAEKIPLKDKPMNPDMNMLFWSDEEFRVLGKNILGKCYVAFIANIQDPLVWSAGGPDRFYFANKYDFLTGSVIREQELSSEAKLTGKEVLVNSKYICENKLQNIPSYKNIKPFNSLDIFAGCGGLSKGLEESGLIKSKWAIESDDKAASAFFLNNSESVVFVEDCNQLLKLILSGSTKNNKNQRIPQKGDVDFICGSPPCLGFSDTNRFNSVQYSLLKNSPIVSFLSFIDYYRPKYFVIDNDENFVSFKRSVVLKLTLRCITRMGYQCTFGILQAGNFGVPQTRRRLIIMAAAPGEQLPHYPEPTHVFSEMDSSRSVLVGDKKFINNCKYKESAPMRTVTIHDAWSDLPEIKNGARLEGIPYKSRPITHLQKLLRYPGNQSERALLIDHICKEMSPLVQARMELIPKVEGSDWRDLPNVEVQLSDGTTTSRLQYICPDVKNGNGLNGALRGVCQCASGKKCNPQDCQSNTIIPWCLPHTGNRHNNWAGLYGRLSWTGYCATIITNPEPMGTQGRVLHPKQDRVISVRECARLQGFKDSHLFYGSINNKHRQIDNAVPPPMGTAIGHEIIKAINKI